MKHLLLCMAAWLLTVLVPATSPGQASFRYHIDGPWRVDGEPGQVLAIPYDVVLSSAGTLPGGGGVQAWSVAIGSDSGAVREVTTAGTAGAAANEDPVDGLRQNGFEWTEMTGGEGNSGAVSAVVLSYDQPVTLPVGDGPRRILGFLVEATVAADGPECQSIEVGFREGLVGSGQPVGNRLTVDDTTRVPELRGVLTKVCRRGNFSFRIEAEPEVTAYVGTEGVELEPRVVLATRAEGVQGWSLSIESRGDCDLVAVTTDGTAGADATKDPAGLRRGGFEKTELAPADLNGGRPGAVSAVVLSFTRPISLPVGDHVVLALQVACDTSAAGDGALLRHRLFFPDNEGIAPEAGRLRGTGQPVKTVVSFQGETVEPEVVGARFEVRVGEPQFSDFIRCDPNADGDNNLADPVWILNDLFRGGPPAPCPIAADCNGDRLVDISDAIFSLSYRFLGGPAPPGPFPDCGSVPEITPELCPLGSTPCP